MPSSRSETPSPTPSWSDDESLFASDNDADNDALMDAVRAGDMDAVKRLLEPPSGGELTPLGDGQTPSRDAGETPPLDRGQTTPQPKGHTPSRGQDGGAAMSTSRGVGPMGDFVAAPPIPAGTPDINGMPVAVCNAGFRSGMAKPGEREGAHPNLEKFKLYLRRKNRASQKFLVSSD